MTDEVAVLFAQAEQLARDLHGTQVEESVTACVRDCVKSLQLLHRRAHLQPVCAPGCAICDERRAS